MLLKLAVKNAIQDSGLLINKDSIRLSQEQAFKIIKVKAIIELFLDILFFFGALIELYYGKKKGLQVKNDVFDNVEEEIEIHSSFTKFCAIMFLVFMGVNFLTLMAFVMKKPAWIVGECYFKLIQYSLIVITFIAVFLILTVEIVFAMFMIRLMEAAIGVFSLIMNFFIVAGIVNYALWSYELLIMAKRHMEQEQASLPYMSASNQAFSQEDNISTSISAPLSENFVA